MSTAVTQGHLSKVRFDLDDTRRALTDWAGVTGEPTVAEALLHHAIEGLLRAVSTLAQVVEDAQRVGPAPATQDCLCLHAIEQVAGQPTVHDRRCLVGYPPTPAPAGWMFS